MVVILSDHDQMAERTAGELLTTATADHTCRIFTIISAIVFVVTLIPDVTYIPTVPGSTPAQTAILMMMHVVAASVILRLLTTARKTSV
jgi:hypothetical protein